MDTAADSRDLVRLEHLSKVYTRADGPEVTALRDLSLVIPAQERMIGLIGPDGAGKSTLMRLLCGLEAPTSGRVEVLGVVPNPDSEAFVAQVSFMPQSLGLYMDLSCWENLRLFAQLRHAVPQGGEHELKRRIAELLSIVGLTGFESRLAGKLSGGMKQKLALATALIKTPRLLLLDEPTVGVDPLSRRELWAVVRRMVAETGMTCLFSTGYIEEAASADRVLFLEEGRLLAARSPQELLSIAQGRCYRLALADQGQKSAQSEARSLMLRVQSEVSTSPLLDAVPRGAKMELVGAEKAPRADAAAFAQALQLPAPRVTSRGPSLEDAYAILSFAPPAAAASAVAAVEQRPAGAEEVIAANGIRRLFGSFVAVADTSFSVHRGEIFGLLGPNGAGKTTTFRMLCGLLAPSAGTISVAGCDLRTAKSEARSRIGYVAQKFSLYGKLTVEQNLTYFARSYGFFGSRLRRRVEESLAEFHLTKNRSVSSASLPLGAKRDLAVACALVHHPEILFLDEATSGADLSSRRAFWRRIVRLAQAGTTVIVTTHFMEEAEYCDRFLIQDAGEVLTLGTPAQVRAQAAKLFVKPTDSSQLSIEEAFLAIVEAHRARRSV